MPSCLRLMLRVCSLSVLESCMRHYLCLFLCMAVRMLWKEKERSRVRDIQMDNLGIRRMNRILNAWIREICGVRKGLDERIDEGILRWFSHVKRMERDRIARRVCR